MINLSADKDRVLREAFRVLKPGGRFAVSDVVVHGEVPQQMRENMMLWVGCIAGALQDTEYSSKLAAAGFEEIDIEPTRLYKTADAREFLKDQGVDVDAIAAEVDGKFRSAFIRARKPQNLPEGLAAMPHYNVLVPLHRQLGALDHGRGDSQLQGTARLPRLQRRQSSGRCGPSRGTPSTGTRECPDRRAAQ